MFKILILISNLVAAGGQGDLASRLNDRAQSIYLERPDSAIILANKSVYHNGGSNLKEMARSYSIKGVVFEKAMKYDSALVNHQRSLEFREKIGDSGLVGRSLMNIGNVYYSIGDVENAQKYYKLSLDYNLTALDKVSMAYAHNNLGNLYSALDSSNQAKHHYFSGLSCEPDISGTMIEADLQLNLGVLYKMEAQYDSALYMYRQAENYYEKTGSLKDLIKIYVNCGVIYKYQSKHDSSKYYYNKALELSNDIKDWPGIEYASSGWLLNKFDREGDSVSKAILLNYMESDYMSDSLSLKRNIQEVEAEYQVEKNVMARKMAEDQAEFQKERRAREQKEARKNIIGLSILGLVVIVLAIVIFLYYRQKSRISRYQLQEKEEEINKIIVQQENEIYEAQLTGEVAERKRIAQELHDRVGGLLATANLHVENTMENPQDAGESVGYVQQLIHETIKEVRGISHNLAMDISQMGFRYSLEKFAKGISDSGKLKVRTFYELTQFEPDETTSRECLKIIRELLTNTLKYANAQTINIQVSEIEGTMQIIYQDDGKGFNYEEVKKGLGLQNMRERAEKLDGKIEYDSTPGRGTTVILTIPI